MLILVFFVQFPSCIFATRKFDNKSRNFFELIQVIQNGYMRMLSSQHFDSLAHHGWVHIDVLLNCRQIFVTCQLHQDPN